MPVYEVELDGETFEVDAPSVKRAVPMARLYVAKKRMLSSAEEGATARSAGPNLSRPMSSSEAREQVQASRGRLAKKIPGSATPLALAYVTGAATVPGLVSSFIKAPLATSAGLAASYEAGKAGGEVGGYGGRVAETLGAPKGTAKVTRTVGELAGAAVGGFGGAKLATKLRDVAAKSVQGAIAETLAQKAAVPAAETATAAAAAPAAEATVAKTVAAEADDIVTAALRMRNEQKLSGAQIISALKQSYGVPVKDGRKLVQGILDAEKGAGAVSPLRVPRIEEGAQKVGRAAGMTKEEVRVATGPVLGEALGEASPVLPRKALQSIIDKMKSLPVAEREAYVAMAKDPKAMAQIENIRRTLEHLGLSVPAWMAAAIVGSQMAGGTATEGGS